MAPTFDLMLQTTGLVRLSFSSLTGHGKVVPRLALNFNARTLQEGAEAVLDQLMVELSLGGELLATGTGTDPGQHLNHFDTGVQLNAPISRHALAFVDEHFRDDTLMLGIQLRAVVRYKPVGDHAYLRNLAVAAWNEVQLKNSAADSLPVPRSEWFKKVLEPLGVGRYVLMELPMPLLPLLSQWARVLEHLRKAEEHYANGNDPEVMQSCFAAFEALEGAPKQIFDQVDNPTKRERLNAYLKEGKDFLHSGRHVSRGGQHAGSFDVDHRDARFALAHTKVWLVYIARLVSS